MKLKNLLPEGINEADVLSASEKAAKASANGKDKPYNETIQEALSSKEQEDDRWLDWYDKDRPSQMKSAKTKFREAMALLRGVRDMMSRADTNNQGRLQGYLVDMADGFDMFEHEMANLREQFIEN